MFNKKIIGIVAYFILFSALLVRADVFPYDESYPIVQPGITAVSNFLDDLCTTNDSLAYRGETKWQCISASLFRTVGGGGTLWLQGSPSWLYNTSTHLYFNETILNETIQGLDTNISDTNISDTNLSQGGNVYGDLDLQGNNLTGINKLSVDGNAYFDNYLYDQDSGKSTFIQFPGDGSVQVWSNGYPVAEFVGGTPSGYMWLGDGMEEVDFGVFGTTNQYLIYANSTGDYVLMEERLNVSKNITSDEYICDSTGCIGSGSGDTNLTQGGDVYGDLDLQGNQLENVSKINSLAQDDIYLFDGRDLTDGSEDGKRLRIYRKSISGDPYYDFYINKWKEAKITVVNAPLTFQAHSDNQNMYFISGKAVNQTGEIYLSYYGYSDTEFFTNILNTSKSRLVKFFGYVNSTTKKYVNFNLGNDRFFHLDREDDNIYGFNIGMPVNITTGGFTTGNLTIPENDENVSLIPTGGKNLCIGATC